MLLSVHLLSTITSVYLVCHVQNGLDLAGIEGWEREQVGGSNAGLVRGIWEEGEEGGGGGGHRDAVWQLLCPCHEVCWWWWEPNQMAFVIHGNFLLLLSVYFLLCV